MSIASYFGDALTTLRSNAGETVTYKRDSDSVTLTAVLGQTEFPFEQDDGEVVEFVSRDFIVAAADQVLSGSAITPASGDEIERTVDGATYTYEVMHPAGERPYRWSDPDRTTFRVHTRLVEEA